MTWKCATCDKVFETIPEDAVLISKGSFSRVTTYLIAGEVHSLRRIMSEQTKHKTWHKTSKKIGCEFCFPSPEPEPPVEQVELLGPGGCSPPDTPLTEPPQPEAMDPEIEDESESVTVMGAAFKRIRK